MGRRRASLHRRAPLLVRLLWACACLVTVPLGGSAPSSSPPPSHGSAPSSVWRGAALLASDVPRYCAGLAPSGGHGHLSLVWQPCRGGGGLEVPSSPPPRTPRSKSAGAGEVEAGTTDSGAKVPPSPGGGARGRDGSRGGGGEAIVSGVRRGPSQGEEDGVRAAPSASQAEVEAVLSRALWRGKDTCWVCGRAAEQECAMCTRTQYCSRECQFNHWPIHRETCRLLRPRDRKTGPMPPRADWNKIMARYLRSFPPCFSLPLLASLPSLLFSPFFPLSFPSLSLSLPLPPSSPLSLQLPPTPS
jgi:hypothetical protein